MRLLLHERSCAMFKGATYTLLDRNNMIGVLLTIPSLSQRFPKRIIILGSYGRGVAAFLFPARITPISSIDLSEPLYFLWLTRRLLED